MCKEMLELADRCERINGPCRQVDARIVVALGEMPEWARLTHAGCKLVWTRRDHAEPVVSIGKHGPDVPVPAYTDSLDAAMSLVEGVGVLITLSEIKGDGMPHCVIGNPGTSELFEAVADTMPLALCAAALRARARAQATEAE